MIVVLNLVICCLLFLLLIHAQRNAEEEAICAPFLTSKVTSPLIKHLERNISYDENAEYSCELVLQDQYLPIKIRATIVEGLYNLALRHIELGYTGVSAKAEKTTLIPREHVAYAHAKTLANFMLGSCYFQFTAGQWSMHPMISRPDEAISYFEHCLTGEAAKDTQFLTLPENQYLLYHHLAKAYNQVYHHEKAVEYIRKLLRDFPFDLEMQFLADLWKQQQQPQLEQQPEVAKENLIFSSTNVGIRLANIVQDALQEEIKENGNFYVRYRGTGSGSNNVAVEVSGSGTVIADEPTGESSSWKPIKYTEMITSDQFQDHIEKRLPFIISLKDPAHFDTFFNWKTQQWFDFDKAYLKQKIGDYQVMVESIPFVRSNHTSKQQTVFGLGINAKREYLSFSEILKNNFRDEEKLYYLNIQPDDSGDKPFRPPLHLLEADIPLPTSTAEAPADTKNLLSAIWQNLTAINLWMGNIPPTFNFTQSRLHRDATDNLYLLYEGRKKFYVWNPTYASSLQTISPIIGTNDDGLTYQWNINEFRNYVKQYLQMNNFTLFQLFQSSTVKKAHEIQSNEHFVILESLLSNDVQYDLENVHFSKLKSLFDPFHIPASFDRIHRSTDHRNDQNNNNLPLPEVVIDLEPGDIFYLPTGFYHEVISYAGKHTAMNLWWRPLNWRNAVNVEQEINQRLFEKVLQFLLL